MKDKVKQIQNDKEKLKLGISKFVSKWFSTSDGNGIESLPAVDPPPVSEEVFIASPGANGKIREPIYEEAEAKGINGVRKFLEDTNFEQLGYNDAVVLPDNHYKSQRIKQFALEISSRIESAMEFHHKQVQCLQCRIDTLKSAGLIELADKIQAENRDHQEKIKKLQIHQEELDQRSGIYFTLLKSKYESGFLRGLQSEHETAVFGTFKLER
ncbi:MAG: hypothetical protein C4324_10935 [Blastocatellia bacterium]